MRECGRPFLYGVHDAVGELGTAPSGQDMNERILHLLRTSPEGGNSAVGRSLRLPLAPSESGSAAPWATSRPRWKPANKMRIGIIGAPIALEPHSMYDGG